MATWSNILYYPNDEDLFPINTSNVLQTPSNVLQTHNNLKELRSPLRINTPIVQSSPVAIVNTATPILTPSAISGVCIPATLIYIDDEDGKLKSQLTNKCIPISPINFNEIKEIVKEKEVEKIGEKEKEVEKEKGIEKEVEKIEEDEKEEIKPENKDVEKIGEEFKDKDVKIEDVEINVEIIDAKVVRKMERKLKKKIKLKSSLQLPDKLIDNIGQMNK